MGNIVDHQVRHLNEYVDSNLKISSVASKRNIINPNLKGSAVAPEANIVDPIIDIDGSCWQLFCLEYDIDPVLGLRALGGRPSASPRSLRLRR